MARNDTSGGTAQVGASASFTVQIPSYLFIVFGLTLVSLFVHICAVKRASYSLRTLIGLSGLSLFLASKTASELASQDDSSVQQLLWCLCTSILTDNYDPNTDAHAWKRVVWMLSTWLQLGLMYSRTSVASSSIQRMLFQAAVVLKGMKLHFLHGWHRSSWDETKDDSKTQCEHLAAVATWQEVDWSPWLQRVDLSSVGNATMILEDKTFFWRSLLEGKPRRATSFGRDCCDIAVKFTSTPSPVVPAVAFSIKRQFKAKLGSMATLSAHYSYLAITEMALNFSIIILMGWELIRSDEKRTLPAFMCVMVWFVELLYHAYTSGRALQLANEVHKQSSEECRTRRLGLGLLDPRSRETRLVITDLMLGSIAEAVVTWLASLWMGTKLWAWLSKMKHLVLVIRILIAGCIMPMAILNIAGKYVGRCLKDLWNRVFKRQNNRECRESDWKVLGCVKYLQDLQDLLTEYPAEMSLVERIMYPSIPTSTLEAPTDPPPDPMPSYSLTALEAVFFSQLLGQAAAVSYASGTEDPQSLYNIWTWISKAFKDGMVDSSWLSPNISRALWHGSIFEQTGVWETALKDLRQVFAGQINPFAPTHSSLEDVSNGTDEGMASLEAARKAVMHLMSEQRLVRLEPREKVKVAMRAGLFAVVAFCRNWGGPETVAVPGPLEHECLMACFIAPAFKHQEQPDTDAMP